MYIQVASCVLHKESSGGFHIFPVFSSPHGLRTPAVSIPVVVLDYPVMSVRLSRGGISSLVEPVILVSPLRISLLFPGSSLVDNPELLASSYCLCGKVGFPTRSCRDLLSCRVLGDEM